eukprot:CAMPEP_0117885928 /NCGR_PEP_ID=MMETSP0950-20121206/19999_1 /TAXON_ID=44440 /ORGANISM="Chattonella subsalsa, Strain CCMP2191" /LENGTH=605 /DNA_ID=CAMNT_0005743043 /DNA_START=37 /DNA_END=1854 /DNA_ORIENTATION=+
MFGSTTQPGMQFGSSLSSPFGVMPSSPFGVPQPSATPTPWPQPQTQPLQPATGGFNSFALPDMQGTDFPPYQPTPLNESGKHVVQTALTTMPAYQHQSFEELRCADYLHYHQKAQVFPFQSSSVPPKAPALWGFDTTIKTQQSFAPGTGGFSFNALTRQQTIPFKFNFMAQPASQRATFAFNSAANFQNQSPPAPPSLLVALHNQNAFGQMESTSLGPSSLAQKVQDLAFRTKALEEKQHHHSQGHEEPTATEENQTDALKVSTAFEKEMPVSPLKVHEHKAIPLSKRQVLHARARSPSFSSLQCPDSPRGGSPIPTALQLGALVHSPLRSHTRDSIDSPRSAKRLVVSSPSSDGPLPPPPLHLPVNSLEKANRRDLKTNARSTQNFNSLLQPKFNFNQDSRAFLQKKSEHPRQTRRSIHASLNTAEGCSQYYNLNFRRKLQLENTGAPSSSSGQVKGEKEVLMPVKLTRPGYTCLPSIERLTVMTPEEQSQVKNFTVLRYNFGEITWPGETDIRGLDLDELVEIGDKVVEVYHRTEPSEKPSHGNGLNKPATIRLENILPPSDATANEIKAFSRKVKERTAEMGAKFLSYDSLTGEWEFLADGF